MPLVLTEEDKRNLKDQAWRLDNLYFIINERSQKVRFRLRWHQRKLLDDMHTLNIVLKARQMGFSTFIAIYMLDSCLFGKNIHGAIIADTLDNARQLLRNKILYAYNNLPAMFREAIPALTTNADRIEWANGSSIDVGTSMRGGTVNILHISELGKIAAKYPDKAEEIRTGALNTVAVGQRIFIESTAEGADGLFYELCEQAQLNQERLGALDFRFHFFPWWLDAGYQLDEDVHIEDKMQRYFGELEQDGIKLTNKQKAWYIKKNALQKKAMFKEYPSRPIEPFSVAVEGAYYADEMQAMYDQGRICSVPYDPTIPVDTWWDIGSSDATAIVFVQRRGNSINIIDYHERSGEYRIKPFVDMLKARGYRYGTFYMPHDTRSKFWGMENSRIDQLVKAGIQPTIVKDHFIDDGISAVAEMLAVVRIDAVRCEQLIKALRNYRRLWDDARGMWRDEPFHNQYSHAADAMRYGAVSYKTIIEKVVKETTLPKEPEKITMGQFMKLNRPRAKQERI